MFAEIASQNGELAENLARLNFTQSELVDIGEAVAEEARAEAHERKIEGGRVGGSKDKQTFPDAFTPSGLVEIGERISGGQSRDAIAKHISEVSGQKRSGRTYEKAKVDFEAALRIEGFIPFGIGIGRCYRILKRP